MTSAAVHCCCITAYLYEKQISIDIIAVAQACCEANLQSRTEQQRTYFALTSAAMHWCCITAYLYEEQICIDVIAVTKGCQPGLQSSTEQQES